MRNRRLPSPLTPAIRKLMFRFAIALIVLTSPIFPMRADVENTLVSSDPLRSSIAFPGDFGRSSEDREVQTLKDFRAFVSAARYDRGNHYITKFFRRTARTYQKNGCDEIARALTASAPTLLELVNADTKRDVNRPRARRAIRRVLRTSLAVQPLVRPSGSNPSVPFYTLIAVNYGDQLRRAFRNLGKSRPLAKNFGKTPRDMWIDYQPSTLGFTTTGQVPGSLTYSVDSSLTLGSSATISGTILEIPTIPGELTLPTSE